MYLALVNRLIGWVGGSSATPPSCSQGGGIHGNSLISWKRMEESEEIDNVACSQGPVLWQKPN